MEYFIPAWYQNGDWKENEQVWYRARTVTEFDDTVKQIQLFFRKNVAPFKILLLGFSPNFRHFLHRQGVYHAPYWSCFDAMQGITLSDIAIFSFHDLSWPEGVEFIYSPFAVIVRRGGEKYAQIEFAEDGNMFRVDMFQSGERTCSNVYDDRGFISCQIVYRSGVPVREQYFDADGVWKFARYMDDGHVIVNPESSWYCVHTDGGIAQVAYRKPRYRNIDEMIAEVMAESLKTVSDADIFLIAMHPLHAEVLAKTLARRKTVLSFFGRRLDEYGMGEGDAALIAGADAIVADKKATALQIQNQSGLDAAAIRVITPYDSRQEFGNSLHLHVQNILLAVDRIAEADFDKLVALLADYIEHINPRARVCLFTRASRYNIGSQLMHRARNALRAAGMNPDLAREDEGVTESQIDTQGLAEAVFSVAQCVDEMAVSRMLREQRVLVDLQDVPDQFLQISAMSVGMPQITARETDYIQNGKNGIVLQTLEDLPAALDYYLSSVAHANQAQIASYELGSQFTTGQLVQSWKEVIANIEHQSTAAGPR